MDTALQMPTTTFLTKPAVSLGARTISMYSCGCCLNTSMEGMLTDLKAGCHLVIKDRACTCPDRGLLNLAFPLMYTEIIEN